MHSTRIEVNLPTNPFGPGIARRPVEGWWSLEEDSLLLESYTAAAQTEDDIGRAMAIVVTAYKNAHDEKPAVFSKRATRDLVKSRLTFLESQPDRLNLLQQVLNRKASAAPVVRQIPHQCYALRTTCSFPLPQPSEGSRSRLSISRTMSTADAKRAAQEEVDVVLKGDETREVVRCSALPLVQESPVIEASQGPDCGLRLWR